MADPASPNGDDAPARVETPSAWAIAAMPGVFVFLWSTGFIGAKFGLPYIEPLTFLAIRFALVSTVLVAVSFAFSAPWPGDLRSFGHIVVAGLLVQSAYLGGVFTAIHAGLSAGIVALIVGLQPILTAIFAGPLFGEVIGRRHWMGIILGLVGISVVLLPGLKLGGADIPAMLLAGIGLVGITAGTLYQKRYCADMDLRSGSAIQFLASAVLMAGLAIGLETLVIQWTSELIFALTWLIFVLSIGAISLLFILIRRGAASKVVSLFYLVPPVTALLAFFMFGETLSGVELGGMIVTAFGVYLVLTS